MSAPPWLRRSTSSNRPAATSGCPIADLWLRYFTLGGMSTALEVEAILFGALVANDHDRDVIAVALNERFAELGGDHPVPYAGDDEEDR